MVYLPRELADLNESLGFKGWMADTIGKLTAPPEQQPDTQSQLASAPAMAPTVEAAPMVEAPSEPIIPDFQDWAASRGWAEPSKSPTSAINTGNNTATIPQQSDDTGILPSFDDWTASQGWTPQPTMGAQPITGTESVPGGAVEPVQRGPETATAAPQGAPQDIEGYIRYAAQKRGIDPDTAVKAANTEGGVTEPARRGTFATGSSWWPFQLHYGGKGYEHLGTTAGMGNSFTAETGIQPGDPNGWKQSVDYALDAVAKNGWGAWYGPKTVGITGRVGVAPDARPIGIESGAASADSGRPQPVAMPQAGQSTSPAFSELTPNQFTAGTTLSSADANAACGPAAAVAFARRNGRNPTLDEAVSLARTVGWNPNQGMAGPQSEVNLLNKMGVAASLADVNNERIAADVSRGNPVILDTPGHYFVAEKYDPESGKFDFGNSAGILKAAGHNTWFTLGEIAKLGMGAVRAAIHMDNPESPSPSVVAGRSAPTPQPEPPALVQAVESATGATPQQTAQLAQEEPDLWSNIRTTIGQGTDRIKGMPVAQALQTGNVFAQQDMSTGGRPAGRDIGDDYGRGQSGDSGPVGESGQVYDSGGVPPRDIRGDYAPRATEPGDFDIPGNTAGGSSPVLTAYPSAQPGGAVEPTPPSAPASSGDSDPWSGVVNALKSAVQSIVAPKPDLSQGARDVQQRATTEPTGPMPIEQIGQAVGSEIQHAGQYVGAGAEQSPSQRIARAAAPGLTGEGQTEFFGGQKRLDELFAKQINRTITPEEEDELTTLQMREASIIGSDAPTIGRGFRGPRGETGILGVPNEHAQQPATERYYHGTNRDFDRLSPSTNGDLGPGAYVSNSSDEASVFSGQRPNAYTEGANVRPIDVPSDLRIARADEWQDALDAAPQNGQREYAANRALQQAGYDGVRRQTGLNSHELVIFPESLGKVRNATAGTPGGLVSSAQADEAAQEIVPPFYSQLERTIEEKMPNRAAPGQVQGILRGSAVKADEIKWTGLDEFLQSKGNQPVTKQEVLDHLKQNEVRVEEVVKGEPVSPPEIRQENGMHAVYDGQGNRFGEYSDVRDAESALERANTYAESPTKFGTYQLPGGENYRELLLTMPPKTGEMDQWRVIRPDGVSDGLYAGEEAARNRATAINGTIEQAETIPVLKDAYRSSHFDEPNILAHVRFNERTDAAGKRVLFVEEVQSDWHQAGREQGYQGQLPSDLKPVQLTDGAKKGQWVISNEAGTVNKGMGATPEEATAAYFRDHEPLTSPVPNAPFQKTWPELAMKRTVRWAAENGFDRVAWTPGAVHAAPDAASRYGTERLAWQKHGDGYALNVESQVGGGAGNIDLEGEALARGLIEKGKPVMVRSLDDVVRVMPSGVDAEKVWQRMQAADEGVMMPRAEGMAGFYDQMLPNVMNKLGKKFGARVGETTINKAPDDIFEQVPYGAKAGGDTVHAMDITPEMKQSVLTQGQPLFLLPGEKPRPGMGASIARGAAQGGIAAGYAESQEEGSTPQSVLTKGLMGAGLGGVRGGLTRAVGPRGAGQIAQAVRQTRATEEMRQSGDPALIKLAGMMDEPPPTAPTGPQAANVLERARQAIVRQTLNRGVTMDKIQEEVVKATGGKLPMEDRITALQRLNPSSTVDMQIQDEILTPLRELGTERPHVSAIMTLKQNIDQAAEKGAGRKFSGNLTGAESQQALDALKNHLGPQRFAEYEKYADTFIDFNKRTLDLGVQGQLVPQTLAQHLNQTYPNYSPTNITKYASIDGPGGVPVGKQIGLSDNGLMKLSEEGTTAAKQDPIEASVAARYDMMRRVHRNQVTEKFIDVAKQDPELSQHVREIISTQQWEQQGRKLQPGQTLDVDRLTPDQTRIGHFDQNAVKHEYLVDDWAKPLIEGSSVPELNAYQKFLQEWRSAVTDRSVGFTVRNVPRDAYQTFNAMLAREGGPTITNVGKVVEMMAESYRDAFKGIREGTFHGNVKDYLAEGGGYQRASGRGLEEQAQVVDAIARTGGVQIKNPMDLYRLATDPLSELNKRFELGPRGAVFGQAKRGGASGTEAVIAARDIMPYEVSGEFTKAVNSWVPFLTARIAGAASQTRLALKYPKTYLPTVLAATTGPAIAIEMYNRMDEDRSKAYDDVPNYLKFMGNVVMLPWAGKDTYGMPLPNYLFLPTGPVSPFSILGHAVGGAIMGKGAKPSDYAEMFNAITESMSPVDTSAGGALSSILGPVGSTAVGLATGKDLFRGSEVATTMGDLEASRASQAIAGGINAAVSKVPVVGSSMANVRPSQVEFAAKGLTGGPGAQALAASNLGRSQPGEASNIQDVPVIGGLVAPLVGNRTGGVMSREADRIMAGGGGQAILDAGVKWRPEPVDDHVGKVGLTRAERGEVQQETNTVFNQNVANVREWVPNWDTMDKASKEQVFKNLYINARKVAEASLLTRYPDRFAVPEQVRRVGIEQERKAG